MGEMAERVMNKGGRGILGKCERVAAANYTLESTWLYSF